MADLSFLSYVLTPASLAYILFLVIDFFKQRQMTRTTKMLLKNGVKHALVTKDQILF